MRDFWLVFKVSILETFGINKLKKKFARNSFFLRVLMPIITVVLGLGLLALITWYMQAFAVIFVAAESPVGLLKYGMAIGLFICFMTTLTKAHGYLFESKDYDLLMSLPLQPKAIIASKVANLMLINYLSLGLTFVPSIFWYGFYYKPGFIFYLLALLMLLIGPLLIITVCSVISYFGGILLARLKHRNFIKTISYLLFVLVIMLFSFTFNQISEIDPNNELEALKAFAANMERIAEYLYYPSVWMADAVLGNYTSLLIVFAISVIPFLIFIYVVGRNFVQANARARVTYTDKNFKLKEQKVTSQLKTLINREIKRYFSSSVLVLNTIIGPIMGTVMVFMLLFGQESLLDGLGMGEVGKDFVVSLLIAAITFMNGMISTTASAISLEGKQFWIIKSAPVTEEKIFISKIFINFIISVPFTIINTVVIMFFIKPAIIYALLLLVIPSLINIMMGVLGLYINLVFPKFDWTAEVKVVKQSLSMILAMFTGMLFVIGLAALFVVFSKFGFDVAYFCILVIMVLILGLEIWLLKTDGVRRFKKLQA